MGFFILVCLFVIIATPLLMAAAKRSGQSGDSSSDFSNDPNFYTSSASERYGSSPDSDNPGSGETGDTLDCNDTGNDSDSGDSSDSGSCDSGSSD